MGIYKIGDKVIPHSKSIGCDLSHSEIWKRDKENNQLFLYIVECQKDKNYCLSNIFNDNESDNFCESDFTLYEEFKKNN